MRTSYLPLPVGFGYDTDIAPVLETFKSRIVPKQLIMVDYESDRIFFRHVLKTGEMTPDDLKDAILEEAAMAYSNLD